MGLPDPGLTWIWAILGLTEIHIPLKLELQFNKLFKIQENVSKPHIQILLAFSKSQIHPLQKLLGRWRYCDLTVTICQILQQQDTETSLSITFCCKFRFYPI